MIGDQPSDEVAFGELARSVDDAGIDAHEQTAVADGRVGNAIRSQLRGSKSL